MDLPLRGKCCDPVSSALCIMKQKAIVESCDRPLRANEAELLREALRRSQDAQGLISQVASVRVSGQSTSAWPLLEFEVDGKRASTEEGMRIVADFQYKEGEGLFGYFVYERQGLLAGMECWSIDGHADPQEWPSVESLTLLET